MSLTREPVPATPRKAMTPARRLRIYLACNGRCVCGVKVPMKGTTIDHHNPLELAGPETDENCRFLCAACDKPKTAKDQGDIGKMRRRQRDEDPVARKAHQAKKRQIANRPFGPSNGFPSHPTMKRGFDGKTRPRQTSKET